MKQDWQLLRDYVSTGSQEAFAVLVERYINLVYSTCRRETNDASLAEDATQEVFLLLARKAPTLSDEVVLSGWLFQTARFVSRDAVKREARRQQREDKAAHEMVTELDTHNNPGWNEVAPLLHNAVSELAPDEQTLVLLRFFENRSLKEIGERLNLSENAAQKRVSRAVEKLRRYFARRGLLVSGTILLELISHNAVEAAPTHCGPAIMQAVAQLPLHGPAVLPAAAGPPKFTSRFTGYSQLASWSIATAIVVMVLGGVMLLRPLQTPGRAPAQAPALNIGSSAGPVASRANERISSRGLQPKVATDNIPPPKLHEKPIVAQGLSRRTTTRTSSTMKELQTVNIAKGSPIMNTNRRMKHTQRSNRSVTTPLLAAMVSTGHVATLATPAAAQPDTARAMVTPSPTPPATGESAAPEFPPRELRTQSLALSRDGKLAVTGREDGAFTVWEARTGKNLYTVKAYDVLLGGNDRALFSPDGKLLLTVGRQAYTLPNVKQRLYREEAKLWNLENGTLYFVLPPIRDRYGYGYSAVAFSADGKLLATKAGNQAARLWNVRQRKLVRSLPVAEGAFNSLAFSPDGRLLACGGSRAEASHGNSTPHQTGEIILWNVATGALLRTMRHAQTEVSDGISCLAFSPDSATLASGGMIGTFEKTGYEQFDFNELRGELRLWDVKSGIWLKSLFAPGHQRAITEVEFSPDGRRLAASNRDKAVRLWNLETSAVVAAFTQYGTEETEVLRTETSTGPPGMRVEQVITVGAGNSRGISTQTTPDSPSDGPGVTTKKYIRKWIAGDDVVDMAFAPDSNALHILSRDKMVRTIQLNAKSIPSDPVKRILSPGRNASVTAFAFTPDSRSIITGDRRGRLKTWRVYGHDELHSFRPHEEAVLKAAIAPRSWRSSSWQGFRHVLATGANVMEWVQNREVVNPPGEGYAESSFTIGFEIKLWDYHSGKLVRTLNVDGYSLNALSFSPDGRLLAAAGQRVSQSPAAGDNTRTAQPPSGQQGPVGTVVLWDVATGELKHKFPNTQFEPREVTFSPDSSILAADCQNEGVQLWNTVSGEPIRTIATQEALTNAFTSSPIAVAPPPAGEIDLKVATSATGPRSLFFVQGGTRLVQLQWGKVLLWNTETGGLERTLVEKAEAYSYDSLGISPDGRLIATSNSYGLKLWDSQTAKLLWESKDETRLDGIEFSPNGKTLAVRIPGGVRLWDVTRAHEGIVQ